MVDINYKINLITYLSCAYPQHGGDERVITRKCTNTDYFFKIIIETVQQR